MSGTEDLKDLLDRLKGEVGPLPPPEEPRTYAPPREEPRPLAAQPAERPGERENGFSRFGRPHRPEAQRDPAQGSGVNLVWSENKETMLFGVLASLIISLGGVLSGLEYLVLIGAVFFILFSLVMFLALFGYYLNFRRRAVPDPALAARLEALTRKVEALGARSPGAGPSLSSSGPEKERELEHKVEELRVLVKSLSRAVEQNNK
ncbi:MAG: hypothetical protein A2X31_05230 [Elusimicrobia bacterium GWB2_63_22]|nr:MAG: hypothetical protein A2X31_05230 [Elusimicrobia bacterium GWB2_63_22]